MGQYALYPSKGTISVFLSNPSIGGAASEAMVIPGLLSTDTVISVTQKVSGVANLPLLGFSSVVNNGLTARWVADPGPNAIIIVAVKR